MIFRWLALIFRCGALVLLCFGFAPNLYAWSAKGHAQIADAAFAQLTETEKRVLLPIYANGPWVSSRATPVAGAAIWPDRIRDLTLDDIFERYGSGQVPLPLRSYHQEDTHTWHFANAYIVTANQKIVPIDRQACAQKNAEGQLYYIWQPLLDSFAKASDRRDKAVILAFLTHLLADAYQPLHTFSQIDSTCADDRGGNLYCVVPSKGNRCKTNLHQLWDKGFGVFEGDGLSPSKFKGDVHDPREGTSWLAAGTSIYPRKPEAALAADYQQGANRLVKQQANLAAAHLSRLLKELANAKELANGR